ARKEPAMARKKADEQPAAEAPTVSSPPTEAPSDTNGTSSPDPAPPPENGNGNGGQKPLKVFSYPVARDTYVQATIWERTITMKGGESYVTQEVTVRKRL